MKFAQIIPAPAGYSAVIRDTSATTVAVPIDFVGVSISGKVAFIIHNEYGYFYPASRHPDFIEILRNGTPTGI